VESAGAAPGDSDAEAVQATADCGTCNRGNCKTGS
jgi:hypothetical protein